MKDCVIYGFYDLDDNDNQMFISFLTSSLLKKNSKVLFLNFDFFNSIFNYFDLKNIKTKKTEHFKPFITIEYEKNLVLSELKEDISTINDEDIFKVFQHLIESFDYVIINMNNKLNQFNRTLVDLVSKLFLFCNVEKVNFEQLIKFVDETNGLKKIKNIYLYNFNNSLENKKSLVTLSRIFRNNIEIKTLGNLPKIKRFNDIENIKPWDDIAIFINQFLLGN